MTPITKITKIEFDLWEDPANKRIYVEEFLDGQDPVLAATVTEILDDDAEILCLEDFLRENKIRIEGEVYYVRVDAKGFKVRFFGFLCGSRMYLVHAAIKEPFKNLSPTHWETARARIEVIKEYESKKIQGKN